MDGLFCRELTSFFDGSFELSSVAILFDKLIFKSSDSNLKEKLSTIIWVIGLTT